MLNFYSEKKLREKLALPAGALRRIRVDELHLPELIDWVKLQGGAIALTQTGLGRVLAYLLATEPLGTMPPDFSDCLVSPIGREKKNAGEEAEDFVITKIYPNRHLLRCTRPNNGTEQINVWVPDNRKFLPKMKLKAALNQTGQYRLVGRCPRKRGRY